MNLNSIKKTLLVSLIVAGGVWLASCDSTTQQSTEATKVIIDSAETAVTPLQVTPQTTLFRTILGSNSGDFRGLNFGDPVSKIKATETFELFEDSTNYIAYTHETDNFETIDVFYLLNQEKLINGIKIETFLNDARSTKNMWDQFDTHFSGKYPTDKRTAKKVEWHTPNGKKIVLEDVSQGKDFGIVVQMGEQPNKPLQ